MLGAGRIGSEGKADCAGTRGAETRKNRSRNGQGEIEGQGQKSLLTIREPFPTEPEIEPIIPESQHSFANKLL